jgi:hypothetical protein
MVDQIEEEIVGKRPGHGYIAEADEDGLRFQLPHEDRHGDFGADG